VTLLVPCVGSWIFKSALRKEKAALTVQIPFGAGFQTNISLADEGMI
jgi:hypothetical protein